MNPDYSKYTYFELLDSLKNIDSDKHPERAERIRSELKHELVNINKEFKALGLRFPSLGIPSDDFLIEEEQPKTLWERMKNAFSFADKPIKVYGDIDASISENSNGKYHLTTVAAYLTEEEGMLNLVLRGEQYGGIDPDALNVARIKICASNIGRLKELIEQVEADIRSRDLTISKKSK